MGGGQPDSIAFGGVITKIIEGGPPHFRALFMMLIEVVEGRGGELWHSLNVHY